MRKWFLSLRLAVFFAATIMVVPFPARGKESKMHPSSRTYRNAVGDALEVASTDPDWKVMRGAGDSMLPLFGDSSLLLVERTDYSSLKVGMIAVYRDGEGDLVAHRIFSREGCGFRAKGFNNRRLDSDPVTGANFLGIVFGVVTAPKGTGDESALALTGDLPIAYGKKH